MKLSLWYPVKPWQVNYYFGHPSQLYVDMGMVGHNGIDIHTYHGQPVYASHDGVCYPEIDGKGGNGVVIRTLKPFDYEGRQVYFKTIYWHLLKADAVVKTGQIVKAGDLIGYADNTGVSTGDHLHFGLKPQEWNEDNWSWWNPTQENGYKGAIDPLQYFNLYYAEDKTKVITLISQTIAAAQKLVDLLRLQLNKK